MENFYSTISKRVKGDLHNVNDIAEVGDIVCFKDTGGYDVELEHARQHFTLGQQLEVVRVDIDRYHSSYYFEGYTRGFNSVMFSIVKG